jgi:DNA-binding beta-propeller fold protein YncE/mono/diheme cytochrome c family protein
MQHRFLAIALLALCTCRGETLVSPRLATPPVVALAPPRAPAPATEPETPTPVVHALSIEPLDASGATSAGAVALARYGEHTLAFVADADDRAVVTFDVDTRAALASTPMGLRPSAVLVTPAGRVVVLGADDARVHLMVLAAIDAPLVAERTIAVPAEPVSASLAPGGDAVLVASRWGHALSIVPLAPGDAPIVVDLPRDPAAVVASADGKRAVVMHAAGSRASVVDLQTRAVTTASLDRRVRRELFRDMMPMMAMPMDPPSEQLDGQGQAATMPSQAMHVVAPKERFEMATLHADQAFAMVRAEDGRLLAPEVFVDTGPAAASGGYGASESTVTPAVVSFDGDTGQMLEPGGDRTFGSRCLLPRGAALDTAGKRMLIACLGSDEIVVLGVEPKAVKLQRMVRVPKGPVAIAVDEEGKRAVVWSPFERAVTVMGLDPEHRRVASTTLERRGPAPSEEALRGRVLFHSAFDSRVSSDGRACASCHPDGRDDGLTWSSPAGPMQTPMLFARLEGTAPYGWDGAAKDLVHHLAHTTSRLGGGGLSKRDVTDVAAYLASLTPPAAATGPDATVVARGADIFRSEQAECASCHTGAALTDGDTHDVESGPKGAHPRTFDTPSLRFIARSAPYFHDGRYATLGDMLAGSDGSMGHTSHLSPEDRAALQAYLETL